MTKVRLTAGAARDADLLVAAGFGAALNAGRTWADRLARKCYAPIKSG